MSKPEDEKTLYIIRGLPGSGKSTLAGVIAAGSGPDAHIVCADDYFTVGSDLYENYNPEAKIGGHEKGRYLFDVEQLKDAHDAAFAEFIKVTEWWVGETVIVANVASQAWEVERYVREAERRGFRVFILECQNRFGSTHNVPGRTMDRMLAGWQDGPTFNHCLGR